MDGEGDEVPNNKWSPDQKSLPPVTQTIKNVPAMQVSWVQSLGREDPLEKGMAIHSSILTWRISWTGEPGWLPSMGSQIGRD